MIVIAHNQIDEWYKALDTIEDNQILMDNNDLNRSSRISKIRQDLSKEPVVFK